MDAASRLAALNADDAQAWMGLARRGALADAWAGSDRIQGRTRTFADPNLPRHRQVVWDGTPVEGRDVLVRCYHGLGDTIQFARYLPALCRQAAGVSVWAQQQLLPVLRTMDADVHWHALHEGTAPVVAEVNVEIMELAHVFRTTLETIPRTVPYLRVRPGALPSTGRPRVGLAWRAGDWDSRRSLAFDEVVALLDHNQVEWYSLQFDPLASERHPRLRGLGSPSILDVARTMQALDLVVTVDSMPAHLAGALGVPTWTLLPYDADWRWLAHRADSPWYPSMRLFRQASANNWEGPIAEVGRALAACDHRSVDRLPAQRALT
jgi:hypothetical protein